MALTKEKLINRLQTQKGISKRESHQIVDRLLEIIKDTLARGEEPHLNLERRLII